jgi:hypothetical protein
MTTTEGTKLNQLLDVVQLHYPQLGSTVKSCLSVCAAMALAHRTKPLSLVLETPSGYGKTTSIVWLFPIAGKGTENYFYRSDNFTPKAFVSHAANASRSLESIDMLPRIRNKVLLTKELAPIFRGREQELQDKFSILIGVLDGMGHVTDTGMQGQRGYTEPHVFNWIGATTPVPRATHRLMSQLGTRLLFWEVPVTRPTEAELVAFAKQDDTDLRDEQCHELANAFVADFFARHPIGSVEPDTVAFPEDLLEQLVKWAQFLVQGRATVYYEKDGSWKPVSAGTPEGPWKVIKYFKELARGHALIEGRAEVNGSDMEVVAHTAVSSIPGHLRPIIRELRRAPEVASPCCERLCGVSRPTARTHMQELVLLGIATGKKGSCQTNEPDVITLHGDFEWLRQP